MIVAGFLEVLSHLSQRALQNDPLLQDAWQALDGTCCRLALQGYPALVVAFHAQGCSLELSAESPVDLSIACTLEEALTALMHARKHGTLMGSKLHISGDLHTAQRLQNVLEVFHPDLLWILSALAGPGFAVSFCKHVWEPLKKRMPNTCQPKDPSPEQIQRFVSMVERARLFFNPTHHRKDA